MKTNYKLFQSHFRCRWNSMLARPLFFMALVVLFSALSLPHDTGNEGSWSDFRWRNKSAGNEAIISECENIINVFRKATVFNPPQGMRIVPFGECHEKVICNGNTLNSERICLELGIRIPPKSHKDIAEIYVWINDPLFLLGDPVLSDESGEIYLLPPMTGTLEGQGIRSRSAHPPGYAETYPSGSMFPLWAAEQEPYLRSVVRPTFKLAKGTVTTMYTSGGKPFWKPVTQERFIRAMIENARKELADFRSGVAKAENSEITDQQINQMKSYMERIRSMYDEKAIIERHTNSMEQAMQFYNMMKESNPVEAEEYYQKTIASSEQNLQDLLEQAEKSRGELADYEEKLIQGLITRQDVWNNAESSIQQGDWDALEKTGKEHDVEKLLYLADAGRAITKLEAELRSLSNAQRNKPAYGFELPPDHPLGPHKNVVAMPFEAKRPSGLVSPDTEGARPLVCVDTEFFNGRGQETDIRILAVEWSGYHELRNPSGDGKMPQTIWRDLDWPELKAMVK